MFVVRSFSYSFAVFSKENHHVRLAIQRDVERLGRYGRDPRAEEVRARKTGVVVEKTERDRGKNHPQVYRTVDDHTHANIEQQ